MASFRFGSKTVQLVFTCPLAAIPVARGVEGILQGEHESAVADCAEPLYGDVFAHHPHVAVAFVEYVIGLKGKAETVVENALYSFAFRYDDCS